MSRKGKAKGYPGSRKYHIFEYAWVYAQCITLMEHVCNVAIVCIYEEYMGHMLAIYNIDSSPVCLDESLPAMSGSELVGKEDHSKGSHLAGGLSVKQNYLYKFCSWRWR